MHRSLPGKRKEKVRQEIDEYVFRNCGTFSWGKKVGLWKENRMAEGDETCKIHQECEGHCLPRKEYGLFIQNSEGSQWRILTEKVNSFEVLFFQRDSLEETSNNYSTITIYWNGLPCPSPGDLPNPGIIPRSPALQADSLPTEPPGKPTFCV